MVRFKSRIILCEIVFPDDKKRKTLTDNDIYNAVREELQNLHGDYGVACTRNLPSLAVKYLNTDTNIVLIRTKREIHKLVQSAIVFIKQIGKEEAFLRTLHLGGTIRSCNKFLIRYHKSRLPLLLQECTTEEEKKQVKSAIVNSCRECIQTRQLDKRRENKP